MSAQIFTDISNKKHFDNIDLMEFIGIFFVIIYHTQLLSGDILHHPSASTYIHYLFTTIMSSCVPIFLFANGFLLAGKELNIRSHVYKIIQLVILTFVWGAINLLCMGATLVNHFLFGGDSYIAFNFFNMFNPFRNLFGFAFSYFCLGCFAHMNIARIESFLSAYPAGKRYPILGGIVIISCILSGSWGIFASRLTRQMWDNVMDSYDSVFTVIIVIALFLLLIGYRNRGGMISGFIKSVSANTLGIYLMHEIFLHLFRKAGIGTLPFMSHIIPGIIYSFLVLCLCLGICLLIRRIPVLRNLTGWKPPIRRNTSEV